MWYSDTMKIISDGYDDMEHGKVEAYRAGMWKSMQHELIHRADNRPIHLPQEPRKVLLVRDGVVGAELRGDDISAREVGGSGVLLVGVDFIVEAQAFTFGDIYQWNIRKLRIVVSGVGLFDVHGRCSPYRRACCSLLVSRT
jgi:hypothetical protein